MVFYRWKSFSAVGTSEIVRINHLTHFIDKYPLITVALVGLHGMDFGFIVFLCG